MNYIYTCIHTKVEKKKERRRRAVWQKIETVAHFRLSLIPLGLWPVKPFVIGTRQRAKLTGPVLFQPARKIFLFIINPP